MIYLFIIANEINKTITEFHYQDSKKGLHTEELSRLEGGFSYRGAA